MTDTPPPSTPSLDAIASRLGAWLWGAARVLLIFYGGAAGKRPAHGARLERWFANNIDRALRALVFVHAMQGVTLAPCRLRTAPRHAPEGFHHRAPRANRLRIITANVLPRACGGLRAEIARILHILRNLDRYAAIVAKRIARGFITSRLIASAPPARRLAFARIAAPAFAADSS